LKDGDPPIYIGFGSIKFDNSPEITQLIISAIKRCGLRAIISYGWADLGSDIYPDDVPETVLFINHTPHPWLFPQCSAVIRHGSAGTTAAGLEVGRPTVVVPFSSDQWFWGDMVARRGAGPPPIPFKKLTLGRLSEAIDSALRPECREVAQDIANSMKCENGCEEGAKFFHAALRLDQSRCAVCPERIACWKVRKP
jgi:UDP:flavonoid glycosyltransferase YjiC (YdhE family)